MSAQARLDAAIARTGEAPAEPQPAEMIKATIGLPSGEQAIVALPANVNAMDVLTVVHALPEMFAQMVAQRPTSRLVVPRRD